MKIYKYSYKNSEGDDIFKLVEDGEHNYLINQIKDEYTDRTFDRFGSGNLVVFKILNDKMVIEFSSNQNGSFHRKGLRLEID